MSLPKSVIVGGLGMVLAIFLGYAVAGSDYRTLIIGFLTALGLVIWFSSGRFYWVLTIASSFLAGTFPILGGAFTPFQILMLMGLLKFLIEDVALRRTSSVPKNPFDMLMITGFMTIMIVHGVHDRFGMRFLGSKVWGGHNYVNVFSGVIALFVVQSVSARPKSWSKLPYLVFAFAGFDLVIAALTQLVPKLVYFIYPFYSAVSTGSLQEAIGGPEDVTRRVGAVGNFGFILILLVLASSSLKKLFRIDHLTRLGLLVAGFIAVLFSGYRSSVLNAVIAFFISGVRDLKAGVLMLIPILGVLLFSLSAMNSVGFHVPKQVQRALAFLPGDWDTQMTRDAAASNDFRLTIWKLWAKEYFPSQPLLGRGFGFQSSWVDSTRVEDNPYFYQQMVETGNLHNGLFSSLDTFGIIGTIFFTAWNISLLTSTLRLPRMRHSGAATALRFMALLLSVSILSFWGGALNVGSFLPGEFALAGAFFALKRAIITESEKRKRTELRSDAELEPLVAGT